MDFGGLTDSPVKVDLALIVGLLACGGLFLLGLLVGNRVSVLLDQFDHAGRVSLALLRRPACPSRGLTAQGPRYLRDPACIRANPKRTRFVDFAMGAAFVLLGAGVLWGAIPMSVLPVAVVVSTSGVALSVIDWQHHRLPNSILYPTYLAAAIGLFVGLAASGEWERIPGVVGGLSLWLLVIGGSWMVTGGRAIGLGDVKFAPLLGGCLGALGVAEAAVGLVVAFIAAGLVVGGLLMSGRLNRRQDVAFGPFLAGGWFVALLLGQPILNFYLGTI